MQATATQSAEDWAQQQFAGVDLGDVRLERRAPQIAMRMARYPGLTLPKQMQNTALLKATYGMLDNTKVTCAELETPHWALTRDLARAQPLVLLVMDVTEMDLTRFAKTMKGVGYLRKGGYGELVHSTLAVVPEPRQVLGLMHQQVFERIEVPEGESRKVRPPEDRESRVWGAALEEIGPAPAGSRQVVVGDRATDFAGFMRQCTRLGYSFCVRLAYDRRLITDPEGPPRYLLTDTRELDPVVVTYADIPGNSKHKARRARLLVTFGEATVRGPDAKGDVHLWVVRAWEEGAPEGVEPLEWFLATDVPVRTVEDALERIEWYTCRWVIEDYHQCLKTGCGLEERDLEDVERAKRLLGFYAPLAVRLLQMRENARLNPDLPASTVADDLTIQILAKERRVAPETLTVRGFWRHVAGMGGFLGRRRDGEPGWKSLWEGWLRLETLVQGARYALALNVA